MARHAPDNVVGCSSGSSAARGLAQMTCPDEAEHVDGIARRVHELRCVREQDHRPCEIGAGIERGD
jgi:hypothetical protein